MLKVLVWDRSGHRILYRRLKRGTFAWPEAGGGVGGSKRLTLDAAAASQVDVQRQTLAVKVPPAAPVVVPLMVPF